MIDKKEIRIGNWFIHDEIEWNAMGHSGYFQWQEEDWHYLVECGIDLSNIHPIPLTEEILLKCGFCMDDSYNSNNHWSDGKNGYVPAIYHILNIQQNVQIVLIEDNKGVLLVCTHPYEYADPNVDIWDYTSISQEIRCLHQLQNLYFALTNTELKINLHSK